MNTTTFTQLTENEIRALLRAELESFFQDKFPAATEKRSEAEIGGIDLAEEITGLKRPTIYALVQRRGIPHMKKGKKLYFKRKDLEAWIESGRKSTSEDIAAQAETFMVGSRKKKSAHIH